MHHEPSATDECASREDQPARRPSVPAIGRRPSGSLQEKDVAAQANRGSYQASHLMQLDRRQNACVVPLQITSLVAKHVTRGAEVETVKSCALQKAG